MAECAIWWRWFASFNSHIKILFFPLESQSGLHIHHSLILISLSTMFLEPVPILCFFFLFFFLKWIIISICLFLLFIRTLLGSKTHGGTFSMLWLLKQINQSFTHLSTLSGLFSLRYIKKRLYYFLVQNLFVSWNLIARLFYCHLSL